MIFNEQNSDLLYYDVINEWAIVAGLFAFLAVLISFYEIILHLYHFNKLFLQKYVIRILMMVPIYAMNSWIGLLHPSMAIYYDTLRECYEAFVIYSFMKYLNNFLYYEMDLESVIDTKPSVKHKFPFCFLPPMTGGKSFLYLCKHGILQYAILRPITTFLALLFELLGIYHEASHSFKYGFVYLLIINNISQVVAMYFLYQFYLTYKVELSPLRPLPKFLSIKAVIFLSFFQKVVISFIIRFGIIRTGLWDEDKNDVEISRSIQNFLICVEMFTAALFHVFAFSHTPFVDLAAYKEPIFISFLKVIDITEERRDFFEHINHLWLRIRTAWRVKKLNLFASSNADENLLLPLNIYTSNNYDSTMSFL